MVADAMAFFSDWLHCRRAAVVLTRKGSPNGQDRSEVLASSCARAYNTLHGRVRLFCLTRNSSLDSRDVSGKLVPPVAGVVQGRDPSFPVL